MYEAWIAIYERGHTIIVSCIRFTLHFCFSENLKEWSPRYVN